MNYGEKKIDLLKKFKMGHFMTKQAQFLECNVVSLLSKYLNHI